MTPAEFFRTLKVQLINGRELDIQDGAPTTVTKRKIAKGKAKGARSAGKLMQLKNMPLDIFLEVRTDI